MIYKKVLINMSYIQYVGNVLITIIQNTYFLWRTKSKKFIQKKKKKNAFIEKVH